MNIPQDEEDAVLRAEKFSLNIALAKLNLLINQAQYNSLTSSVMPNVTTSLSGTISESTRSGNNEGVTLSLSLNSPIFYTQLLHQKIER